MKMRLFLFVMLLIVHRRAAKAFAMPSSTPDDATLPGTHRRWCKLSVSSCIDQSVASSQFASPTAQGCLMKASLQAADLVVQWSADTNVCSMFQFQQVCLAITSAVRWVDLTASALCIVYRSSSLSSCQASLDGNFLGVWLADGSNRLSNLVCQSDPSNYQMQSFNIRWTAVGAEFNGYSSYALLNDSRFAAEVSAGFTWLMRLRRQPRVQPLIEMVNCSNFGYYGPHMWEFNSPNGLYFYSSRLAPIVGIMSESNLLLDDSNAWIDVGISNHALPGQSAFFYNGSLRAPLSFVVPPSDGEFPCYLIQLGRRLLPSAYYLKGTIRAVAIARGALTIEQMNRFFQSLPKP